MDAQRTSFVLTIAALLAGTALAEPPSQSAPVRYSGNDWSSAGPTSAPTISASSRDRYGNPQYTYPQNTQPPSVTSRAQSAFNETSNSLRNGVDAGVRSVGSSINSTAKQAFGTTGYLSSQSTNPFATQLAAPPASSNSRSLAPPPWPTGSGTPAAPPTTSWDSSTPVTPVDRSVPANPSAPPSSSSWTSIGSTIAAPPLLTPQLPTMSTSSFPPLNTTPLGSGPAFTTDSYRGNQPSSNSSTSWAQQSTTPSNVRSTSSNDDFAAAWDASANNNNNNGASIGRTANNPSRPAAREPEFPGSQRVANNQQDTRSTVAKPADSWGVDSWTGNSQSPNVPSATIGGSKTSTNGSPFNTAPPIQAPANAPSSSPPTIGSANNNPNFGGPNSMAPQQPVAVNAAKPTQTANGESQSWTTLVVAILGLAFSIAFNVYLGWSYLDARQKYQALVRRTADTFRRAKVAA